MTEETGFGEKGSCRGRKVCFMWDAVVSTQMTNYRTLLKLLEMELPTLCLQ